LNEKYLTKNDAVNGICLLYGMIVYLSCTYVTRKNSLCGKKFMFYISKIIIQYTYFQHTCKNPRPFIYRNTRVI
jgi:hypothetical protein